MRKFGIIGVGIIAVAVVEGFCTAKECEDMVFFLSPRNKEKSAALKEKFPDRVTVCDSNQAVVDASDVVFLSLLGKYAEEELTSLRFRKEQMVVSVMSDQPVDAIKNWVKPVRKLVRMVPLPLVTTHKGPIVCYPADEEAAQLFAPLGDMVNVEDEDELLIVTAITGLMSTYYMLLHTVAKSAADYGLNEKVSMDFTALFFHALAEKATTVGIQGARDLAFDEMTPGGLNELAMMYNIDAGTYKNLNESFVKIMERMGR